MNIAKVFWSGRSQAVRLPKEFRFDTKQTFTSLLTLKIRSSIDFALKSQIDRGFRHAKLLREVRIRRHGQAVILEPVAKDWGWLDDLAGTVDDDFESAVAERPPSSIALRQVISKEIFARR